MELLQRYPEPHPQTAGRLIDGEAVLILAESAEIDVLNAVGSRIFELADGSRSTAEIAAQLAAEYDVPAAQATTDTIQFLSELVAQRILVWRDTPVSDHV